MPPGEATFSSSPDRHVPRAPLNTVIRILCSDQSAYEMRLSPKFIPFYLNLGVLRELSVFGRVLQVLSGQAHGKSTPTGFADYNYRQLRKMISTFHVEKWKGDITTSIRTDEEEQENINLSIKLQRSFRLKCELDTSSVSRMNIDYLFTFSGVMVVEFSDKNFESVREGGFEAVNFTGCRHVPRDHPY